MHCSLVRCTMLYAAERRESLLLWIYNFKCSLKTSVSLLLATDNSLIRTLRSIPSDSALERFDCISLRVVLHGAGCENLASCAWIQWSAMVVKPVSRLWYMFWTCCLGPSSKDTSQQILLLQKRALRIINFSDTRDHAIPLFIDANVLPLYYQTISNLIYACCS